MLELVIKKNNIVTNGPVEFNDETGLIEWLETQKALESFGPEGSYEVVITDVSLAREQALINQQSEAYLLSTDWYIIRELDNGTPCPEDIKLARAEARLKIVR